jgi:CRISPR/Cas system CSM-associated protein Csm2 small subunit
MRILKLTKKRSGKTADFAEDISRKGQPEITTDAKSERNQNTSHHLKQSLHRMILDRIDLRNNCLDAKDVSMIRVKAERELDEIIGREKVNESIATKMKDEILDEIFDLGPLNTLLDDSEISEMGEAYEDRFEIHLQ